VSPLASNDRDPNVRQRDDSMTEGAHAAAAPQQMAR
jgi:hypothetical protein